jgi:transposase
MDSKTVARRRHSARLKADVLAACTAPGASVAAVALAHGLNANLVHKWRRNQARPVVARRAAGALGEFIALPLRTPPASETQPDIRIELRRGPTTVTVNWPMAGAGECAAWLRDWLR